MTPGLLDLPSELLEKIGHELTPVDLLHLRLTSRRLESSSQYSFAKRFFSHRAFILKDPGELAAISQKPDIAVALRSLSIRCRHEGFTIDRDDPLVPEGGAPLTYRLTAVFESTQTAVIFSRLTKLQSIEFKPMLKGNWHNLSLANVTGSLSTVLVALKVNSIKPDRIWMCEQFPAPATVGVVDLASLEQLGEGLFELRELGLSILTVPPESYVTGRFRRLYQVGRQLSHCIPHLRSLIYLHLTFDQMSSGTPVLHWLGRVAQPLPALTRFQLDKCKTLAEGPDAGDLLDAIACCSRLETVYLTRLTTNGERVTFQNLQLAWSVVNSARSWKLIQVDDFIFGLKQMFKETGQTSGG